ncbi:mitochondrial ribosomal protein S30 [Calliopsis andreniformis]|uniref:mitochondrial ribosomal protein S30 n=1 Tax=Calliopsis andreniformis TaxID=337506 RepID=UPI003FCCBF10
MFVRVQKPLNYFATTVKNVTRKYALPSVIKFDETRKVEYPPILDLSKEGRLRRNRETWSQKIKKLETVEEKLFGINMPRYYGWHSFSIKEGNIPYNSLSHAQYVTRTHVVNDHKLPEFYNNLSTFEEYDVLRYVRKSIEDLIAFEYQDRIREPELIDNKTNAVAYQINRIILTGLSSTYSHLMEAEIDFAPRVEAFWFVGGVKPAASIRKSKLQVSWMKNHANNPVNIPIQYIGSPILQLRNQLPLKEIIPLHESENSEFSVPEFKFYPRILGYQTSYRHGTSIPGFWPGDPAEFGLLSYHNTNHLSNRSKSFNDDVEAVTVQAIFASYGWLLSQACYQGFSIFNDITYPLVSQTVLTNGQWWTFCVYQLNTVLTHSQYADENPVRNMCWITEPMKLFDTVENGKVLGFNEDVLQNLIKFYTNVPEERIDLDMKPYLGESVKHIANIPEEERRTWLEQHFKHIMSCRPRFYKIPEVRLWQKIYLIDHKTRPMDKKRDPWQFGYNPMKRRMDDHLPIYVPRCLRKNPKKRQIDRWAKTYYPDA